MRQAINFICGALLSLCLYAPCAQVARAQESGNSGTQPAPRQTETSSTTTSAAPPQKPVPAKPSTLDIRGRASERLVDETIPDDAEVKSIIAPYRSKVEELNQPIGKLSSDLKRTGMGGGALGNFVADALRAIAQKKLGRPVLLAVLNSSGLRKNSILAGDLSTADIYELLPFENALVTLDLTGEQLLRFMDLNVQRRNAQSGARVTYRNNAEKKQNEMVSVRLGEPGAERDIDPKAAYTIVTIDFLVKRGGDYEVLQQGKNLQPVGITMRDAVIEYVKAETAAGRAIKPNLDGRFKYEGGDSKTGDEQQ